MLLSIVIPVFNGARTVRALVERQLAARCDAPVEIILVNDGSVDDSHKVCRQLVAEYPAVTYVRLSRNFGEHNAVLAGLHEARGDYAVIMDDDCQNPPEEVAGLLRAAVAGDFDVVYTCYERKQHHWCRNLGSWLHNHMATWLLGKPKDLYLSSFKCLNRFAIDQVVSYSGPFPYLDGLILRCTRNIGTVTVRHDPRCQGQSGYTLRKLLRLWLNMFLNFSIMPLRLSALLGVAFSVFALLFGLAVVIEKIIDPDMPVGWASTILVIMTFSGVQLLLLGLFGEYLGSMYLAQNQTPQFVVRDTLHARHRHARPERRAGSDAS